MDHQVTALLPLARGKGRHVDSPEWARISASLHSKQRSFVEDRRQGKIGKAGRGAGKSYGLAAWFHRPSATHPGCSSVFITISAERSRDILLPAIWDLNTRFSLGIEERRKDNSIVWPNGYRVMFRGCKDRNEANKRRGTPWVAAAWDECDAIESSLLEYDIHECVEPRLMDYDGRWAATGTPGAVPHGYWHKLSGGDNPQFPLHEWDARDNTFLREPAIDYFIRVLQRMQGVPPREKWPEGVTSLAGIIADPQHWHLLPAVFVREYLGRWVIDLQSLIYKITPKNTFGQLPIEPDHYTIGCDLGAGGEEDPELDHAAITVACSNKTLPFVWVLESRRLRDITVDTLAARLVQLCEKYPKAAVHIDSASAGKIIEKTYRKWGVPIRAAEKGPKKRRIELVQSAIANGNLQLHITDTMDLRHESTALVWSDDRKDHNRKCADDCWDSALYAITPHLGDYRPEENPPKPGSKEWQQAQEMAEYEAALQRAIEDAA